MSSSCSFEIGEDKHLKYRRRLYWQGLRLYSRKIGRTLLLCVIPVVASLVSRSGDTTTSGNDSNGVAFSSFSSQSPMLSNSVVLTIWWCISALAVLIELYRMKSMTGNETVGRSAFPLLMLCTYLTQVIAFVVLPPSDLRVPVFSSSSFSSPLPASSFEGIRQQVVNSLDKSIKSKPRAMRGMQPARMTGIQPARMTGIQLAGRGVKGKEERHKIVRKGIDVVHDDSESQSLTAAVGADENGDHVYSAIVHPTQTWEPIALEQLSSREIVLAHQERCHRGVVSVIFAAYNEQRYMEKTLYSVLNSTQPAVIKEMLIVDDGSHPPMTTSFDTALFGLPLVRVLRNEKREGLIRSKTSGANTASGQVIVFLDAHVKPDPGWVIPILRHVNTNYKRIVVPEIPVLNGTTWVVDRDAVGQKMMFDWDLSFHWFHDDNDLVPCMSGGLLAMTRRWWHESGELDTGMSVWGAENIEQSLRTWLCGGEIVVAHDSVIAHVFRPKFPYSVNATKVLYNQLRTVEVWLDEYKDFFYDSLGKDSPALLLRPKVPIPFSGHGASVDSRIDSSEPFINISRRLELRETLRCKPFSWYVDKFKDVFRSRNMLPTDSFLIRHAHSNRCVTYSKGHRTLQLSKCDPDDYRQRWTSGLTNTAIQHIILRRCWDAAMNDMPSEWRDSILTVDEHRAIEDSASLLHHRFIMYPCERNNVNQEGWTLKHGTITFKSLCVQAGSLDDEESLFLTYCKGSDASPLLSSSGMSQPAWGGPSPSQSFDIYARRVLQPAEIQWARTQSNGHAS